MIVNVICDECEEAVATSVVYETKWKQIALCPDCLEGIDRDVIYACKYLVTDIKEELKRLVADNPECVTSAFVKWFVDQTVVPVFLTPFDTAVKDALRDREVFRPIKVEGRGNALSYEVIEHG